MQVLVTGGAGYIGSHTAKELARAGYEPVVLDHFGQGNRWAVRWGPTLDMDLSNRAGLRNVFRDYNVKAVIHFAASAYVGQSMHAPAEYFRNNVENTLNLLDAMREAAIGTIVFSSTCATYGNPEGPLISEDDPQRPVNPYGESKLMVERILRWYEFAYRVSWMALRYFNAAGADPDGELGELHNPETHLIPRAIAAAYGDLPELEVFGSDYSTFDGTAIRDYIHVTDLAGAHLSALEALSKGRSSGVLNLGTGHGHSVRQVICAVEQFSGRKVPVVTRPRRPGDPAVLIANASRAARELGWVPRHSSLEEIVDTACRWYLASRSLRAQVAGECTCDDFSLPGASRELTTAVPVRLAAV